MKPFEVQEDLVQDKKLGGLSQAETPEAGAPAAMESTLEAKAADASTVDTLKATDASEALKATVKAADASADASRRLAQNFLDLM